MTAGGVELVDADRLLTEVMEDIVVRDAWPGIGAGLARHSSAAIRAL